MDQEGKIEGSPVQDDLVEERVQGQAATDSDHVPLPGVQGLRIQVEDDRSISIEPGPPTSEEIARFYSYVEKLPNGCHFWAGGRSRGEGNKKWYGSFKYRGKSIRAHRFAKDFIAGEVCPPGYHRDHTCEFSLCVNDEHIEIVTHEENQRRKMERRAAK